jgi:hypothetical protein
VRAMAGASSAKPRQARAKRREGHVGCRLRQSEQGASKVARCFEGGGGESGRVQSGGGGGGGFGWGAPCKASSWTGQVLFIKSL